MNGTRLAASSMCGIVIDNGRDCPGYVHPDAPLNLCSEHFEQAHDWIARNSEEVRPILRCGLCGEMAAYGEPGAGYKCIHCGHEAGDVSDFRRPNDAELEALNTQYGPRTPEKRISVVYYLRFADRIKIGTSTDFRKRREAIPHDDVLALERGGPPVERRRHSQFASHRLTGEWFASSPELLAHVRDIRHPGGWAKQLREWEGKTW